MNKILILFLLLVSVSCKKRNRSKTPEMFINYVIVKDRLYSRDSASILFNIYSKVKNHEAPFQNTEYYDSTRLYLDTLIYDSTLCKIAIFVIAENPTYRNPYSDSKLPYYYNANCFLGKRIFTDSSSFQLKNIGPVSIINFLDLTIASKAIRKSYCYELSSYLDADGIPLYDYNLNDKRFWNSSKGWKRVFP